MRRTSRSRQAPVAFRSLSFRASSPSVPPVSDSQLLRPLLGRRRPERTEQPVDLQAVVEQDSLRLTLPVPPSVNHQYATVNGRRLLSARGRTFKDLVGQQILLALAQSSHRDTLKESLQEGRLSLSIRFFFASALRRDVDGGLKITQDALCEHLGINDNRVVELHVYKRQDRDNPRMELRLSILSADTEDAPRTDPVQSPPSRCR